jgi:tetratricopeptide (TPR) repeat protein
MLYPFSARLLAGVFILLLAACSTPQTKALRGAAPAGLPAHTELSDVPFYPQEVNQCGPATLAMVMHTDGLKIDPGQLKDFLYLPEKQGSLQVEMLATARRYGLLAYLLRPELQDVLTEVAAGNPVIVLQNQGLSWYPLWHYAVVIGYDLVTEDIILRSGSNRRLLLSFATFEHTWARSQYWAMLALPPTRLPQTASPDNLLQSISALQYSSPATDVWPTLALAMQRWPGNLPVHFSAGNHAYNHGQLELAEQIFLKTTQDHPESAAAFNNLAQTLSDLGKYDEALQKIHRALEIGGPLEPIMLKTLAEIEQKKHGLLNLK